MLSVVSCESSEETQEERQLIPLSLSMYQNRRWLTKLETGMGVAAFGAVGLAAVGAVGAFQMASWVSKEAGYADGLNKNKTSKPTAA